MQARGGGSVDEYTVPSCKPEDAVNAASSIIEDMESQPCVHAWGFLARLVCTREAFRDEAADPTAGSPDGFVLTSQFPISGLVRDDMALIQGLYSLGASSERRRWIRHTFETAMKSEVADERTLNEDDGIFKRRGEKIRDKASGWSQPSVSTTQLMDEAASNAAMRPGRLMDTVRNLKREMEANGDTASEQHKQECTAIYKDCRATLEEIGSEKTA